MEAALSRKAVSTCSNSSTVWGISRPRKLSHLVLMKGILPMVWIAVLSTPSCSIQGRAQMWPSVSVHMVRYSGYFSKTACRLGIQVSMYSSRATTTPCLA